MNSAEESMYASANLIVSQLKKSSLVEDGLYLTCSESDTGAHMDLRGLHLVSTLVSSTLYSHLRSWVLH